MLTGGLHRGDRTALAGGDFHQPLRAALALPADVEVIPHQMEEGIAAHKIPGTVDCVAVAQRFGLGDEVQAARVFARHIGVGFLVAGADDQGDVVHPRGDDLLDENAQDRLLHAVPVDEGLQGQGALSAPGRGDECFGDVHGCFSQRWLEDGMAIDWEDCTTKGQCTREWGIAESGTISTLA
jgi:hypothetical protein